MMVLDKEFVFDNKRYLLRVALRDEKVYVGCKAKIFAILGLDSVEHWKHNPKIPNYEFENQASFKALEVSELLDFVKFFLDREKGRYSNVTARRKAFFNWLKEEFKEELQNQKVLEPESPLLLSESPVPISIEDMRKMVAEHDKKQALRKREILDMLEEASVEQLEDVFNCLLIGEAEAEDN